MQAMSDPFYLKHYANSKRSKEINDPIQEKRNQ